MSVLDEFLGGNQEHGGIAKHLLSLLSQHGGYQTTPEAIEDDPDAMRTAVHQLSDRFQQNDLGHLSDSWIGTGQNQNVDPDTVHQGLGSNIIDSLAERTGIGREQLLSAVSSFLPGLADKLSPGGQIPDSEGMATYLDDNDPQLRQDRDDRR